MQAIIGASRASRQNITHLEVFFQRIDFASFTYTIKLYGLCAIK